MDLLFSEEKILISSYSLTPIATTYFEEGPVPLAGVAAAVEPVPGRQVAPPLLPPLEVEGGPVVLVDLLAGGHRPRRHQHHPRPEEVAGDGAVAGVVEVRGSRVDGLPVVVECQESSSAFTF